MYDQKQRYLVIEQARTLRQWFRVGPKDSVAAYNLVDAGYTSAHLTVRSKFAYDDESEVLFELDSGDGGIVFEYVADDGEGNAWSGYISAPAADTNLSPWQDAVYDFIVIHSGGDIDTISRGPAMLIPAVTVV